ncbi:energy-coupling factor ABC transporter permease [Aliamphritea spongicola]|nr:energy-coupling factor ABC transporter permease [Aliamphritea spongicola]
MSLSPDLLSGPWFWLAQAGYLFFLLFAVYRAPWQTLFNNRQLQHLFLGAAVVLMLLWQLRAGISPGLAIHFVGITVLTLMFGWDLAILAASMALLGLTIVGQENWQSFGVNGFCTIVIPALVSIGILRLVEAKLTKTSLCTCFSVRLSGPGLPALPAG